MATTRLRKTFRYPADSDSDPDLDEQDQETLISSLTTNDKTTTSFYRRAFVPLPLVSLLLYLPAIFAPSSSRAFFIASLSLTSLVGTAWILYYLPLEGEEDDAQKKKPVLWKGDARGPVERYIVALNGALSGLLALVAVSAWRRGLVNDFWTGVLPGGALVTEEGAHLVKQLLTVMIRYSHLPRCHLRSLSNGPGRHCSLGTSKIQLQGCMRRQNVHDRKETQQPVIMDKSVPLFCRVCSC